jgi:sugar phosphate isomerase/epimerase
VINRRRLPGEGEFPIVDYVAVCRELGYDGPWGVEVLSEELRNLPIEQIFDARTRRRTHSSSWRNEASVSRTACRRNG